MRKYLVLSISFVFIVSALLIFFKFNNKQPENKSAERKAIVNEVVQEATRLANKTSNDNVDVVMDFLQRGLFMAEPEPDATRLAIKVTESTSEEQMVAIVPLLKDDQKVSKAWSNLWNDKSLTAIFFGNPPVPMIVLKKNDELNKSLQALILVHEGSHAVDQLLELLNDEPDPFRRRTITEYRAYSCEFSLLDVLGGEKLHNFVMQEAKKMENAYQTNRQIALPDYSKSELLDSVFGRAKSDQEGKIRLSLCWLRPAFQTIDNVHGKNTDKAESAKLDFLHSAYLAGNMK